MNTKTAKWVFIKSSRDPQAELRVGDIVKCVWQISDYDSTDGIGRICAFNGNTIVISWDNPTPAACNRHGNRIPYAVSYFANTIAHAKFELNSDWESEFEFV